MAAGPKTLAEHISSKFPLDHKPIHIKEHIAEIMLETHQVESSDVALEKAEKWWKRTKTYLSEETTEFCKIGRPTRYSFNTSSDYLIQGACFVERLDSPELKESKEKRLYADHYSGYINDINPAQFEELCGKIISLLGVINPVVTRQSADEGIDFYGQLSLESMFFPKDLTPTIQTQLKVWLVGQAKHYKRIQTGTSEIRELVGSIELGRAKIYGSLESPHPELKLKPTDPVFCLFFTTGTISANAWRLLKRSGVIAMDGEMISAFLADRAVGMADTKPTKTEFFVWLEN